MDLENKFSYHFLEGLTLTEDGILTQGNEQVYIPQKELGVLIVLLESAGHVVLKDMIIESVWKNIIVSDESLTRCIYSLRCIFEKIGYDRCIETIYRKGYRFSGQVFKTKINEDNTSDYSIAIFPFTTSLNTLDPLILNQELVQIISNKKIDGLGFAPIFPDICYHLTHYKPAAADIPVASDNPAHYADAIRYNARTPLQGSLLPLTRLVWA